MNIDYNGLLNGDSDGDDDSSDGEKNDFDNKIIDKNLGYATTAAVTATTFTNAASNRRRHRAIDYNYDNSDDDNDGETVRQLLSSSSLLKSTITLNDIRALMTLPSPTSTSSGKSSASVQKQQLKRQLQQRKLKAAAIDAANSEDYRNYCVENLNSEQLAVHNHVLNNLNQCTLIQAGPGTGKTFTMLTLARTLCCRGGSGGGNVDVHVIIYKHDLLRKFKNLVTCTHTVASFFMAMFEIRSLTDFKSFETFLCCNMTAYEFVNCIVGLLRRAKLPDSILEKQRASNGGGGGVLIMIDEYTVIPKPMLFVLLCVLECHKIGTLVGGDHKQLQNIHNSVHTAGTSAYDIVRRFAAASIQHNTPATAVTETESAIADDNDDDDEHQQQPQQHYTNGTATRNGGGGSSNTNNNVFRLNKNERCVNGDYNEFVAYLAQFSSESKVDQFGFAVVAAELYRNLSKQAQLSDTHLAAEHRLLSKSIHTLVTQFRPIVSFYYIDVANVRNFSTSGGGCDSRQRKVHGTQLTNSGLYKPTVLDNYEKNQCKPDQFLPYIPLVIGNTYFLNQHSENNLAVLEDMRTDDRQVALALEQGRDIGEECVRLLMMRCCRTNKLSIVGRVASNEVLFDKHRDFLLGGGCGVLYNFPVYPANTMSIHMCQGRTITGSVSIDLTNTTYQGLYVAVSRITDPRKITHVDMLNSRDYALSAIMNFEELCYYIDPPSTGNDDDSAAAVQLLPVHVLAERFENYHFYNMTDNVKTHAGAYELLLLMYQFNVATTVEAKLKIRAQLVDRVTNTYRIAPTILVSPNAANPYYYHHRYNDSEAGGGSQLHSRAGGTNRNSIVEFNNKDCMNILMDYRIELLAASRLPLHDTMVWLYEFMRAESRLSVLNYKTCNQRRRLVPAATNVLYNVARLEYMYNDNNETSIEYIDRNSRLVKKRNNGTPPPAQQQPQHYIKEHTAIQCVSETSAFQADVYKRLKREAEQSSVNVDNIILPVNWLFDWLKTMLVELRTIPPHQRQQQQQQTNVRQAKKRSNQSLSSSSPVQSSTQRRSLFPNTESIWKRLKVVSSSSSSKV